MGRMEKLRKGGLIGTLVASLLFSSGCAAFLLLGAGGTAGYLIKEGEEQESPKQKKESSESQTIPSSGKTVEGKRGAPSNGKNDRS